MEKDLEMGHVEKKLCGGERELAAGKHTKYMDCVCPMPWRGVQAACAGVESASDS